MVIDIVMPKMGESIIEGTILEWKKKVGESIEVDEVLLEIGTDKVDSEIPSPVAGKVVKLLAAPNEVIEVGKVIAQIDSDKDKKTEEEKGSSPAPEKLLEEKQIVSQSAKEGFQKKSSSSQLFSKGRFFTSIVRKIATKEGIGFDELNNVSGSGSNNRVTKQDILTYIKSKGPKEPPPLTTPKTSGDTVSPGALVDERVEMDHMRKIIAEHMRKSVDSSAHVYVFSEVDMTHIVKYISKNGDRFKEKEGFSLTYTPFIVSGCVQALLSSKDMNSSLEGTTIVRKKNVNIGIAVALGEGLMVPVLANCEKLDFLQLAHKLQDLVKRTREKEISPEELQDSTFTITNFGVFDVISGTPIINQPNVGILGVGTIKKKPVVISTDKGDEIGIRNMMMVSLGFDHRLIDGAEGSRFITSVCQNLINIDLQSLNL
ncbi:MAG: diapophytoene dehydrogenase [Candidatus Marinimicrobia bacterium]|jgi:2-oxoglutarate dehydrogenase E2 component (dihydrolipoamide succinyltransferase)|nr:diapophytoene dehydrogenase [Candidatus Neomarinimicrobiota bacterium]|tara:strand:- start:1464 stop:2750 length:1287 start_codon:yes stop_codon:yes gene_type:complete